jgi:transposase
VVAVLLSDSPSGSVAGFSSPPLQKRGKVTAALPKAQIVVDHFHVIQHVMKAFRKVLSSWAHRKEGMILLHRKQYLFLREKEDLTQKETQEREKIGTRLPALLQSMAIERSIAHVVCHRNDG